MATWIPNQPVFFGETDACNSDDITINQIVDNTDTTQFQFELEPCVSAQEIVPDPNFTDTDNYVLSENWSIEGNQLCLSGTPEIGASAGTGTSGTTFLSIFTAGGYYQVTVIVDSISIGGQVDVLIGALTIGSITSTGTYTFYGFADTPFGVFDYPLFLVAMTADTNICVSSLTSLEILTNLIFAIYTSDGTYTTEFSYANNPTYFEFVDNTVTMTLDWSELSLSNNCYYICLLDPCENTNGQNYPADITNCTFTGSATGWTLDGAAAYGVNDIGFSGIFSSIYQANVFNSFSTTYSININVTAIAGTIDVFFGTNVVGSITTTGIHTISGIPASDFGLLIQTFGSTATVRAVCADTVATSEYTCNQQSNTFALADYSNVCTKIINACNNENGLGFNFSNSGFTPRLRVEAKLRQSKYNNERSIFEDSQGTKKVYYFSGRKVKDLCIDLQPEYIHDFLRLLLGFDNVYIDTEPYFVEDDEYSIEYDDTQDNLAKVKIAVSKKTQNIKNINCSDTQNVCTLPPDYLLQADDLAFRIVQTDGYGILING